MRKLSVAVAGAVLALVGLVAGTAEAVPVGNAATGMTPYHAPPFAGACVVHEFGEGEAPALTAYPDDPLCVEYAKRDITLDNGGAVRFLLAEPARFAIVAGKCGYWQQDHWSVQASRGQVPVIRWDGSYWYDQGSGQAGARITGLTIGGRPATLVQAAALVAPYSPALAAYLLTYAHGGDGMSFAAGVPFNPSCA